jgi:peptidoglycan/LPS O-acetylase OafA/YrhL
MNRRNEQLDGLRGYAASAVIVFHCFSLDVPFLGDPRSVGDVASRLAIAIFNGSTAVSIFFVLSGAVLMDGLLRQDKPAFEAAVRFAVARIFRIYPALVLWVLVTTAYFWVTGRPPSATAVLENLALYQFDILGQSATLNAEILAIPFLLAVYFVLRNRGLLAMLIFCVAILTAARHMPPRDVGIWLRAFAYPLVLGLLIPTAVGRWIAHRLPARSLWLVVPAMLLSAHWTERYMTTSHTAQETFAALLVTMLFYKRASLLGDWLARPHAVFLGTISYSLYLANIPFLDLADRCLRGMLSDSSALYALIVGPPIVLATIPFALASYRLVESPCIRLGRALVEVDGRGIRQLR